jgi:hypothetical protein
MSAKVTSSIRWEEITAMTTWDVMTSANAVEIITSGKVKPRLSRPRHLWASSFKECFILLL